MFQLTLQLYSDGQWLDAMILKFPEPEKSLDGPCRFAYTQSYLVDHLEAIDSPFAPSVSACVPLEWDARHLKKAPAFLHDIAPAGAAKKILIKQVGREKPEHLSDDLFLLGRSTPGPIGHLRIKESYERLDKRQAMGFSREDVIVRDNSFLEYAHEQGAAIGGATGAGGEAPKLLMAEGVDGLLYPDATLEDARVKQHWFIKFARNKALERDQIILRSEFHYYKALQALGIETVPVQGLALEEGRKPSLWMQRFDRNVSAHGVERYAVESIYSLAQVTEPGSAMSHLEVVQLLAGLWARAGQQDHIEDLVAEYLRRDLINKILGNSDNHGRNTAIIRGADSFRLAPIYDLAPMVMDDEGITRTTKWPLDIERAGEIDWRAACESLSAIANPGTVYERLRSDAEQLRALPDLLRAEGLPEMTMNHPQIALKNLDQRLREWGLK
ncbi:type II toxin-antitoxin system HipA family toxin [Pseudomonas fragi]|uniref:type II toxin-antitoxin system HipA family toxin n=1 Tax=Pseudomonas fragi TaxID=296 RepID=UPI001F42AEEA|nr:HipA domain-containing protein [Pseudomonas fragi]MCF6761325.1 HipA domain-containing protein [Pseudomonas fragi]MCK6252796.1 HipA domain-containing protein [Pseudomonas fragi]